MTTVYKDADADLWVLQGKVVGVLGYGNQGSAQALNLRDSGVSVMVGCIPDEYQRAATRDGQAVKGIEETVGAADILMFLLPDEVQPSVYKRSIEARLRERMTLCFASGYNIRFNQIQPPRDVDVVLLAPRTLGLTVRETYTRGEGVMADVDVWQDYSGQAWPTVLALAKGIGCTRAGVFKSTFAEETEVDLFSEQALWPALLECLMTAYEVLVESGYSPEAAALELYASGESADIFREMARQGLFEQMRHHSLTSQYGVLSHLKGACGSGLRERMKAVLASIRDGSFTQEWSREAENHYPNFTKLREQAAAHPLASADQSVRRLLGHSQAGPGDQPRSPRSHDAQER